MKKLLTIAALGLAAASALAQGQFNFANRVTADNLLAPVKDADNTTLLAGTAYLAQAYVALTDGGAFSPVGTAVPFRTGNFAGYISATAVTVPGAANGTKVWVQMRAWEAAGGNSYEAAKSAGKKFGQSNTINLNVAEAPAFPPNMLGLQSFALVPEPSTMALGVLGAAALMLRRRK